MGEVAFGKQQELLPEVDHAELPAGRDMLFCGGQHVARSSKRLKNSIAPGAQQQPGDHHGQKQTPQRTGAPEPEQGDQPGQSYDEDERPRLVQFGRVGAVVSHFFNQPGVVVPGQDANRHQRDTEQ